MKQNRMMLFGTAVVAVLFLLALGVPSASADTLDYTLTVGNSAISSFGPYGTVDVNRTSNTTATITFTALTGFRLGIQAQAETQDLELM